MELIDLWKRVADRRKEQGLGELGLDELETVQIEARRTLCELDGGSFSKEVSLPLTGGVAYIYRLSPATNLDVLWESFGRVKHSDDTEVTILPYPRSTSRDLTYPRFIGYYWGCIESNGNDVTLTVWEGDGQTAAPDGTLLADFQFVQTLANWPQIQDSVLVAKCLELSMSIQKVAA